MKYNLKGDLKVHSTDLVCQSQFTWKGKHCSACENAV